MVVDIESFAFARAYQTLINFTQKKSLENSVLTAKDEIVAIMNILVKQDLVGSFTVNGEPAINITEISTQALVGNGQTLVLGGIFQSEELNGDEKVPLLGDLPLVGGLFKKQMRSKDKREILIFIAPKIIDNR